MGCSKVFSVRVTAGRTQSTADSGAIAVPFVMGLPATYADALTASIMNADVLANDEVSGGDSGTRVAPQQQFAVRPPLVECIQRLPANHRVSLFFVADAPADLFVKLRQQVEGDVGRLKILCFH